MRRVPRLVRLLSWVVTFAAIGVAVAAWSMLVVEPPRLDADDAADLALDALAEAGIDGRVDGPVEPVEHDPEDGDPVDAWAVFVTVGEERIELRVQQSAGRLVFVDDRIGEAGTERLLDDGQFEVIRTYRDDSVLRAEIVENVVASAAAAMIAVVGYRIARRSGRIWR